MLGYFWGGVGVCFWGFHRGQRHREVGWFRVEIISTLVVVLDVALDFEKVRTYAVDRGGKEESMTNSLVNTGSFLRLGPR